jgi:hypothetical protein
MTEEWAEKVIAADKTLEGAIKSITDKARAKQFGGSAAIRDVVVFGWLREYYGLPEVGSTPAQEVKRKPEIETSQTGLYIDLLDLL